MGERSVTHHSTPLPSVYASNDGFEITFRLRYNNRRGGCGMPAIDEMKSRWVYSELGSPRWGHAYETLRGHTKLLDKAQAHTPFAALSPEEHAQLLEYAPNSSRRGLIGRLAAHSSYHLAHWTRPELNAAHTTHHFGDLPYPQFLAAAYTPGDKDDPHEAAKHLPYTPATWEAAIAVGSPGNYMLIDGYTRSLVFMQKAPPDATFAIWIPDK